ncbi:MAG: TetR/AcrR family transcriptional regulator [Treponema sp.]|nr:TetR/AcrR family transcriptional regulator [Treponema sp.]
MSTAIKHEKRRREILTNALDVFVEEGFECTTFQKIADRCGITRTTLYIYFKNKKDIFNYSIKLLLAKVEDDIKQIQSDDTLDSIGKITQVLLDIFEVLEENRKLLSVILDYLLHLSKGSADPGVRVRRRTIRLRHILASLVIEGIKAGEIRTVSVKTAGDYLYAIIEAAIFRLVVLRQENIGDLRDTAVFAVDSLALPKPVA